tara:strand:- start:125 stop:499 length:375 start_codon:yes stop_codon:yes gene_type:complete
LVFVLLQSYLQPLLHHHLLKVHLEIHFHLDHHHYLEKDLQEVYFHYHLQNHQKVLLDHQLHHHQNHLVNQHKVQMYHLLHHHRLLLKLNQNHLKLNHYFLEYLQDRVRELQDHPHLLLLDNLGH